MMADSPRDPTVAAPPPRGDSGDSGGAGDSGGTVELPAPGRRADGPVAAALISAGIGVLALGVCVVLADASLHVKEALTWSDDVGSLSGKTCLATIAYLTSWVVLHMRLRRYCCDFQRVMTITFILVGLSQVLTFPPFYGLFSNTLP